MRNQGLPRHPTTTSGTSTTRPRTVLSVRPRADFVETNATHATAGRALAYLEAGIPVHLRGPSGSGKTTLALHLAAQLGRPVLLLVGDEEFATSDLVGAQSGYRYRKVVDRFIHSVLKYEEDAVQQWVENRLTTACREGFTLVYDEFTRSRPEANNVLLTVLEERLLILPGLARDEAYLKVHPEFRAIFTSNPQEYAGVHKSQDALLDRMITLDLAYYDRDTEIEIAAARAELAPALTAPIVDIVRDLRDSGEYDQIPSLRSAIMVARMVSRLGCRVSAADEQFVQLCLDVLESRRVPGMHGAPRTQRDLLLQLIGEHATAPITVPAAPVAAVPVAAAPIADHVADPVADKDASDNADDTAADDAPHAVDVAAEATDITQLTAWLIEGNGDSADDSADDSTDSAPAPGDASNTGDASDTPPRAEPDSDAAQPRRARRSKRSSDTGYTGNNDVSAHAEQPADTQEGASDDSSPRDA